MKLKPFEISRNMPIPHLNNNVDGLIKNDKIDSNFLLFYNSYSFSSQVLYIYIEFNTIN